MGAYVREFGAKFARFIAVWTMGLAYGAAALFYQATHFNDHPVTSSLWIIGIIGSSLAIYYWLKKVGRESQSLQVQMA